MKKLLLAISSLFIAIIVFSQAGNIQIIPQPLSIKAGTGNFVLDKSVAIVYTNGDLKDAVDFFNATTVETFGLKLNSRNTAPAGKSIRLTINPEMGTKPGGYTLTISPAAIAITGVDKAGVFHGLQSLVQLIPADGKAMHIPVVTIRDEPRFGYRGLMLDVGRHYFSLDQLKKMIDRMALLKFNTLHWHLTEDQGWRIEIKKYPLLTQVGAYRDGTITGRYPGTGNTNERYGDFYTQEEVKALVKYASERNITIIPEIEMPGHSSAAIAAYPWLSTFPLRPTEIPGQASEASKTKVKKVQETWGVFDDIYVPTEQTFQFLEDEIDEVIDLFPSTYIHIGGDEAPKKFWVESDFCQQLIKEKNLKDEHGLQSYFIQRMEKYINSKGKKIIGWDEILEGGLAPNATVMSWRGESGGIQAAKEGHDVIMTPTSHCYLDYSELPNEDSLSIGGNLPMSKVYSYDPIPVELRGTAFEKHILGTQGNLWTEYIPNGSKMEYKLFPRAIALSEVAWSSRENKNYADFEKRLPAMLKRFEKLNTNYSRAFYGIKASVKGTAQSGGAVWQLSSNLPGGKIEVTSPKGNQVPITAAGVAINENGHWVAVLKQDGKVVDYFEQPFFHNLATGRKISTNVQPRPNWAGPDGGNPSALVNGIGGSVDLSSGEWLGYLGKTMEATIQLDKISPVNNVKVYLFHDPGSWIYHPQKVELLLSTDGINFTKAGEVESSEMNFSKASFMVEIPAADKPARFVKLVLTPLTALPKGHPGEGQPSWIFIDEISVE